MYATILIEMNVPLVKISALLGHSSVHTTFEYYCEVMDENENILAFMNNAFVPVEQRRWREMKFDLSLQQYVEWEVKNVMPIKGKYGYPQVYGRLGTPSAEIRV